MKLLIKPLNDSVKTLYHDSVSQESNNNRSIRGDAGFDVYFPKDLSMIYLEIFVSLKSLKYLLLPFLAILTLNLSFFL